MTEEPWTIGRLLTWTIDYLEQARGRKSAARRRSAAGRRPGVASGSISTRRSATKPTEEARTAFRELVRRRAAGTPVAYLVGHREFYSLEFEVTPDVLIPRPETELLVVALLDHVKERQDSAGPDPVRAPNSIADVGTGSGILAVCAAKYVPNSRVTAIDISPAALAVARAKCGAAWRRRSDRVRRKRSVLGRAGGIADSTTS